MRSRSNRREFIRTAVATTTLVAVAATGFFEIAAKAAANQASLQRQAQQVQLPPVASLAGQSSTQVSQGASSEQVVSQSSSSAQLATSTAQQSSSATTQISRTAPAGYVLVAQVSSLSGKTSAYFTHPLHGNSMLLSINGQWRAFSATCTHRVCTLEFTSSELYCPCHGATFSAVDGSVTRGPARVTLGEYGVIMQDGGVYVSDAVIN